jgi:sortase A
MALLWCAVVLRQADVFQHAAAQTFEAPAASHELDTTPVARLQIPRIQLSAMVVAGDDDRALRVGPGHVVGTAWPGQPGNVAIAGHRDTFFRPLRRIRVGDDIVLVTKRGPFHYRVSSLRIVAPGDVSVLDSTRDPALTLITCYPFSMIGPAPRRFVVRADLTTQLTRQG